MRSGSAISGFIPVLKLGIPMVIQSASIQFSMMFVNSWINSFGIIASAMTGIGNKLNGIIHMVNMAFSQVGSAMIGQNIGAAKYDRVPVSESVHALACICRINRTKTIFTFSLQSDLIFYLD